MLQGHSDARDPCDSQEEPVDRSGRKDHWTLKIKEFPMGDFWPDNVLGGLAVNGYELPL